MSWPKSWRPAQLAACAVLVLLACAAPASATIPSSLKTSCTVNTPHPGYSYKFCNDGLPAAGGLTPNQTGALAVTVPAKYQATGGDSWTGLPVKAADAASMPGADTQGNVALDVDISVPTIAAPAGGYPLIVFMHGCCAGDKTSWEATSFDGGGEKWHYSNAWFASRGYVVVNYTARGFVNGDFNGNQGSTGETQLDSRRFEINDFQSLAGQITDDSFFNVNPQRVVTTGGSYGGGFSWLALTDPFWNSPGGTPMKLAAVAPKYGWTDLVDSLMTTGRHFLTRDRLSDPSGSESLDPLGIPKKSIVAALYDSGKTGIPPGSAHTTFAPAIDDAFKCLQSTDPFETNPLCANAIETTLPEYISDRSAYYQNQWFSNIASNPAYRIPIFNAATFTDPLFPPVENLRMSNRIESVVPGYPIQQYFGDYQHFVQNKAKEWGDLCGTDHHVCTFADYPGGDVNATPANLVRTGATTRLGGLVDHYAQPPGNPSQPQPSFDVTASLQICPGNASQEGVAADEPGPTFTAAKFEGLATNTLRLRMTGSQVTVNDASPNPHAGTSDPVTNFVINGGRCPSETTAAGAGVATYDSAPLPSTATMVGATAISIDYSATSTTGAYQLNTRLYDVFPNGTALMVDRGVRRVTDASGTVTYQLHGNGWRFRPGHIVRVEVAQDDDSYVKASSMPSTTTITGVTLQIPVRETFDLYPRPGGGSPLRVPLVPEFVRCNTPNSNHIAPLDKPSCSPSQLSSSVLTTSTIGKGAGSARLDAIVGDLATSADEADIGISANASDVRLANGSDYVGKLLLRSSFRLTDRATGFFGTEAGTTQDFGFGAPVDCITTVDPALGSSCSVNTSADALLPGLVKEGKRMVLSTFSLSLDDAGPDGNADAAGCPLSCGNGDESTYLRQGVFAP